ncbi:integral membrane protein [Pseudarthrobacter siccitolerans]|uniref:Integral membrane protein n=1 Tax=Pseudarthrobacter siccitolerans TaxID=861266 RepID=A0ABU0PEX8_9MICC|nr:integral membrane protein [Pseudarthrobacter siccitolerans]
MNHNNLTQDQTDVHQVNGDRTGEDNPTPVQPVGAVKALVLRAFRILAVAEAFSWAALLAGMYFKWIAGTTEIGVQVAGPVHGALFVGYGITVLALWRLQRWPFVVAVFAGISAVFPFATLWFERWAGKRGHLPAAASEAAAAQETSRV